MHPSVLNTFPIDSLFQLFGALSEHLTDDAISVPVKVKLIEVLTKVLRSGLQPPLVLKFSELLKSCM